MLFTKMNEIIDEINEELAEREELTECIAISLLAKKNLFILGDTGQAKSDAINKFRKRITGAKQFERLMSKQTDEEQLFGRLNLSSLIPGNMPEDELLEDDAYSKCHNKVTELYERFKSDGQNSTLKEAAETAKELSCIKHILCAIKSNSPKIITEGKIPDSHIVFLDEVFKANDGILNSLLTALNEKVYTNEGQTVKIPVISFFSASNEIPDFKDSAQAILKPLYDRFELKVLTHYVAERSNRMKVLKLKAGGKMCASQTNITLSELEIMQNEAESIAVPDKIFEMMDDVLCALRRNGIHVSDRKYFGFLPIVKAKAYLNGNMEVSPKDLLVLKNYFWNTPEEIPVAERILTELCENPLGTQIADIISKAGEALSLATEELELLKNETADEKDKIRPYIVFSNQMLRIYDELIKLKTDDLSDGETCQINSAEAELEKMLEDAAKKCGAPYITLRQRKQLEL